ncbi:MAG: hypothetical protein ACOC92_00335 [bacterium]
MATTKNGLWTPEVEAAHRELSALDVDFRREALASARLLDRGTFQDLHRAAAAFQYQGQSWPTFVDRRLVKELERVSIDLSRVIRRLPEVVFNGDPARIARFYGLPDADLVGLVLAEPNGIDGALSRGDFLLTGDGFRCIEFNMTSSLGGWEAGLIAEMLLHVPEVAEFVARAAQPVTFTRTFRCIFEHLVSHAVQEGIPDDRIDTGLGHLGEVASADPGLESALRAEYRAALAASAPGFGGDVFFCDCRRIEERDGAIHHRGRRVHVLVELFANLDDPRIFRAFKRGRLALHNGPARGVLSDKRNLALLWEHRDSPRLQAEERRLIAESVPWTLRVVRGTVDVGGEECRLEEVLARRRERLVLKQGRSRGGEAVVLGKSTSPSRWDEVAREALEAEGEWVVQEALESKPYLYQHGAHGAAVHDLVWGPFVAGSAYAGAILRAQPRGSGGGVVNLAHGATEGALLEVG